MERGNIKVYSLILEIFENKEQLSNRERYLRFKQREISQREKILF